jgi:hypothetical protein
MGGALIDGSGEVPLAEDTEEYELEILDGPGGTALRTETGITTTSFTYTSGMQSADFGGAQTELSFVVYQISAQVGRGFRGRAHRGDPVMSNNLEFSQVAAAQNQKEVTINDQAGQLDAGLTDKVDVALTGITSPLALNDTQALRCMVLKLIGASTGTFATAGGGAETFAAGDRLALINENPADATLADLSITFLGKRN